MMDLEEVFEKFEDDEFLKFERIASPMNKRPDLCAFLMLDSIVPPKPDHRGRFFDMVTSSEHDEFYLDVDIEQLAELATEDQIRDLIRCGVLFDRGIESLKMLT